VLLGAVAVLIVAAGGTYWLLRSETTEPKLDGAPEETGEVQQAAAENLSGFADDTSSDGPAIETDDGDRFVRDDPPGKDTSSEEQSVERDTAGDVTKGEPLAAEPSSETESDGSSDISDPATTPTPQPAAVLDEIDRAVKRYESGDVLAARHELNRMLKTATGSDARRIREKLAEIANETIFSKRVVEGDPLADTYTIQAGDHLINVAKNYHTPYEIIMELNGIQDARRIRENQRIKVLNGPFNAAIQLSEFRMDIYLQDLYVRSYRVGLGARLGTPAGKWKVKNKLKNPTFFPPDSYGEKRVIAADDPDNPLGERWIGLEGVEGEAIGQEGFGIHGTIEPNSIGKAASLGCVRMLNEDVEFVYGLLSAGQSMVKTIP
jgi:lipoprotein-anchoring transpeptidase ErfK/SrfK